MRIIKVGSVELTEKDIASLYNEGKYICTYAGIYQLYYSANCGYSGRLIIPFRNFEKRGRWRALDYKTINHIIGKDILIR